LTPALTATASQAGTYTEYSYHSASFDDGEGYNTINLETQQSQSYAPGPSNVSISPSDFTVGTATSFTISGNNLGTNCPTLSFPFPASYSLAFCTDQAVTGTLTATGGGSGNLGFTSGGFGGQGYTDSPGSPTPATEPPVSASGGLQVSISGGVGVPVNGTGSYVVTISGDSSASVTLTLTTTSGSGSATFSGGESTQTITQTTTVTIQGAAASSTANNIQLQASSGGTVVASTTFSVVSVSISLSASGSPSGDDTAAENYTSYTYGNTTLGQILENSSPNTCDIGVELRGAVTPKNYTGMVFLRRTMVSAAGFNGAKGQTSYNTGRVAGQDDTSGSTLLDSNPGSNGAVYDLDAPGIGFANSDIGRIRFNYNEYAVLDAVTNTQSAGSLAWYARDSCVENPKPTNGYLVMFSNDVPGDNTAGTGTTPLTWNLQ